MYRRVAGYSVLLFFGLLIYFRNVLYQSKRIKGAANGNDDEYIACRRFTKTVRQDLILHTFLI